jgi:hypothetical protein
MPFDPAPGGSFDETHTDEGGAIAHYYGRMTEDFIGTDAQNRDCEDHWHLKKGPGQ